MKVIKYILSLLFLPVSLLTAQNVMTSSPYSMFGVGEIDGGRYGANAAMGGVAIGMRGGRLINSDNPASLTGMDSCRLLAEVSAFAKWESYQSKGSSNDAFTGNLSRFALAGRIIPRWYAGVGLVPFSSVGYYFKSSQPLEGSPGSYYNSTFYGDGGLSKFYLTNAFQVLPSLSVGVNVNYIFGNMSQTEDQSTMSISEKLYGHTFSADLGVQYYRRITRDMNLTLGATYGFRQKISMEKTKTLVENSTSTDYTLKKSRQTLPQSIGVGGSLEYRKWTYALDYLYRQYSSLTSADSRVSFHDSHELRAGVCYFPAGFTSENFWKRTEYKIGVDLSTPYMRVNGQSGLSWRINAGLGFPVMNGRIHTAVFYDRTKLEGNALQRSLTGITVTYTITELFHKIKL